MGVTLKHLLASSGIEFPVTADPEVTGISDHSSKVKPGNIFVAIRGYQLDGNRYIDDAIKNGAVAIITDTDMTKNVPVIVVNDTRIALADLSNAFYNYPAKDITMIGVTASNGKTTTAFMIDKLLGSVHPVTGLIGTVIVKDGKTSVGADLTTPNSLQLFELLDTMRLNKCSHVTMEVSSAGLEMQRVRGIPYDIATFNNVSREHIDLHGSFENYWNQKSRLITELQSGAIAILNADDPLIYSLKDQTEADVITYSLKGNPADVIINDVDLSTGAKFTCTIKNEVQGANFKLSPETFSCELRVLGLHNIYNSTVALLVAKLCGVSTQDVLTGLYEFGGVERRFQLIYDMEYKIIDDHFANSGNIDITLETLNLMSYNKLILVLAIRGNRGEIVNKENAETIAKWLPRLPVKEVLVTSSKDTVGLKDIVSDGERKVFLDTLSESGVSFTHYDTLKEAIQRAAGSAETDDVVMLAGCQGMDHGAHLILPMVAENQPNHVQTEILKILEGRVAGTS